MEYLLLNLLAHRFSAWNLLVSRVLDLPSARAAQLVDVALRELSIRFAARAETVGDLKRTVLDPDLGSALETIREGGEGLQWGDRARRVSQVLVLDVRRHLAVELSRHPDDMSLAQLAWGAGDLPRH